MPEGPEIHIAAKFINDIAKVHKFGGRIVKSEVSTKNPDVPFSAKHYHINATARGKELKVFLKDAKKSSSSSHILFRFGMSGCFKFTSHDDLPKHAHLRFFTVGEKNNQVLSFVDYRRFGRWEIEGDWGKHRGPDPILEYKEFRSHVLDNLEKTDFNKPICEVLLNQKYFNGIGNYLRAEILYRAEIPPFTCARDVLEDLRVKSDPENKVKSEPGLPDLIELCHIVPEEVLHLDKGKNYDPDDGEAENKFSNWLRCYYVEGMDNLKDGNGRTIWFSGEAGPMKPKNAKTVGRKGGTGSKVPKSGSNVDSKLDVKQEPEEKLVKSEEKESKVSKNRRKTKLKTDPEETEDSKGPKSRRKTKTIVNGDSDDLPKKSSKKSKKKS